jgi:hypothetical protein
LSKITSSGMDYQSVAIRKLFNAIILLNCAYLVSQAGRSIHSWCAWRLLCS